MRWTLGLLMFTGGCAIRLQSRPEPDPCTINCQERQDQCMMDAATDEAINECDRQTQGCVYECSQASSD